MTQQQFCRSGGGVLHGAGHVWLPHPEVIHAAQEQVITHLRAHIPQVTNPDALEARDHRVRPENLRSATPKVIVIAQHGKHAERRFEPRQFTRQGFDVFTGGASIHGVTRQHDQIGLLPHGGIHPGSNFIQAVPAPKM